MVINDSIRKYILLGIILMIVGGVFVSKIMGAKQDEEFALDDALYQQATNLNSEGNYSEAAVYSQELLKRQPDSEIANYLGGLLAVQTGEVQQAVILLQKVLDINPYKAEDAMFMLRFAEVLILAERNEDAKIVLERCRTWGWAPEEYPTYQERVTELLMTISAEQEGES